MGFVLLHARGPKHHACSANMTGLATPLRMAAGRLESGHGTGAAAWKRAEQQEELHSGAGAVARFGLHDAVPAGHGIQAVRKLLARMQRARWMHARLACLSAAMVPRVHRL